MYEKHYIEAGVTYTFLEREALELSLREFFYTWKHTVKGDSGVQRIFCHTHKDLQTLLNLWGKRDGRWEYKIQYEKMLSIISKNPGLDAIALKGKGWRPNSHGSLREAEIFGLVKFVNSGWYLSDQFCVKEGK
jgi:hypothetical protein